MSGNFYLGRVKIFKKCKDWQKRQPIAVERWY